MSVKCAPYDSADVIAYNWGAGNGKTSFYALSKGHHYRIRQNGIVTGIKMYCAAISAPDNQFSRITTMTIQVWRKNGTNTYDLIGQSENIISQLAAVTMCTVTFTSPITGVQEGDYIGYGITKPALGDCYPWGARTGVVGIKTYYVLDAIPGASNYDWESKASSAGVVEPIEIYMVSPDAIFIGDSIISGGSAGVGGHRSYCNVDATDLNNPAITIPAKFRNVVGFTYQNMGIGSQTSTDIKNRFAADVVALQPKIVFINCGVNDIAGGVIDQITFISNYTDMLNASVAASIRPIAISILPWTNGTTGQMQDRDAWNSALSALIASYPTALLIDCSSTVGQFRVGGDANNLWDIQALFDDDGVHFNEDGHEEIARKLSTYFTNSGIGLSPGLGLSGGNRPPAWRRRR